MNCAARLLIFFFLYLWMFYWIGLTAIIIYWRVRVIGIREPIHVKVFFAWFDFWVGYYYDRKRAILYTCPVPMFVLAFAREGQEIPTI